MADEHPVRRLNAKALEAVAAAARQRTDMGGCHAACLAVLTAVKENRVVQHDDAYRRLKSRSKQLTGSTISSHKTDPDAIIRIFASFGHRYQRAVIEPPDAPVGTLLWFAESPGGHWVMRVRSGTGQDWFDPWHHIASIYRHRGGGGPEWKRRVAKHSSSPRVSGSRNLVSLDTVKANSAHKATRVAVFVPSGAGVDYCEYCDTAWPLRGHLCEGCHAPIPGRSERQARGRVATGQVEECIHKTVAAWCTLCSPLA